MRALAGGEIVDVAFTEPDGRLNRFEPMSNWSDVFKDAQWQINDKVRCTHTHASVLPAHCYSVCPLSHDVLEKVLVRPKYEHLYFNDSFLGRKYIAK